MIEEFNVTRMLICNGSSKLAKTEKVKIGVNGNIFKSTVLVSVFSVNVP